MVAAQQCIFSIRYDSHEDRLRLTLQNKELLLEGYLTRRLLRGFIKGLPGWLEQRDYLPKLQAMVVPFDRPQRPHASQARPRAGDFYQPAETFAQVPAACRVTMTGFLIETISLSAAVSGNDKFGLHLAFISADKQGKIALDLFLNEFSTVITALVNSGVDWGLVHPWPVSSADKHSSNCSHVVH